MDYFKQRREYRNFKLIEYHISNGQNNLYRELLDYANDEGYLEQWFPMLNSALTNLTGLSESGLVKARNELIVANLIEYRPGNKKAKRAPQYKLVCLYSKKEKVQQTGNKKYSKQSGTSTVNSVELVQQTVEHKDLTSTIPILDIDNKYIYQDDLGVYEFIQQAWKKAPTGLLQGALGPWIKEWGPELVLYAFKLAYENSVEMQGLKKYVQAILNNWVNRGIKTLEAAQKAQEVFKATSKKNMGAKGYPKNTRVETLPDWANEKQEDVPLSDEEQADLQRQMQEFLEGK
ncbi:TPA: DnaD domain protein [Enterococcus faecalis]